MAMKILEYIRHRNNRIPMIGYRLHTRVIVGIVCLAVTGVVVSGIWMRFIEPSLLALEYNVVRLSRQNESLSTATLRVLHLSDLHLSDDVPFKLIEKAIELGISQEPDLILLTGDYITAQVPNLKEYGFLLSRLTLAAPTFACLGNHDGGKWALEHGGFETVAEVTAMLRKANIRVLQNEWDRVVVDEIAIGLLGVGDLWAEDCSPDKIVVPEKVKVDIILGLCHNPDAKKLLAGLPWDILFCGHAHGGQFVVPIIEWRPFAPIEDRKFAEGIVPWNGRFIHISRGVGNVHGLRFNCRPEVSVLDIHVPKDKKWTNDWFPTKIGGRQAPL